MFFLLLKFVCSLIVLVFVLIWLLSVVSEFVLSGMVLLWLYVVIDSFWFVFICLRICGRLFFDVVKIMFIGCNCVIMMMLLVLFGVM